MTQGLLCLADGYEAQSVNHDLNQLFGQIASTDQSGLYVLVDFHQYLKEPVALRHIKDVLIQCPQHTLILLSQSIEVPDELRPFATHYNLPLPTAKELNQMVRSLANEWKEEQSTPLKLVDKGIVSQLVKGLC